MSAIANTVFSRIARGKRTDYVELLDARTAEPIADIELPNAPRFLVGTTVFDRKPPSAMPTTRAASPSMMKLCEMAAKCFGSTLAATLAAGPVGAAEQGAAAAKQAAADLAAGKADDPVVLKAPAPNARRVYVYRASRRGSRRRSR
jgi:hypothetical protein